MDVLFGHLKEKLDGTLVIKALAREPAEVDDFAAQLADAHVFRVRDNRLSAAFSNLSAAISGTGRRRSSPRAPSRSWGAG